MGRKPTKMQRMMRWDAFKEERADDALYVALKQQASAREEHDSATSDVERIGAWKAGKPNAALDLAVYGAALELEQRAVARAQTLHAQLEDRERSTTMARDALSQAIKASRVSSKRGKREALSEELERERRTFDQLADLWTNNRETRR